MKRIVLLLLLIAATSLHAQTREEITVEVVNVPVYVYQNDLPVEGLTRDQFELLVNGKPQPIDYFDVMDLGQPVARPGTPAANAEQRRLFVLLFDMTFSSPERILRGQRAATSLVEHAAPADAFAVATFSPGNGLEILLQFTDDHEAILGTVKTLRPKTAEIAEREGTMEGHEPAIVAFVDMPSFVETKRPDRSVEIAQPTAVSGELSRDAVRRIAELGVTGLADLGAALAKIDGFNKHVILLSEGFRVDNASLRTIPMIEKMQESFHGANAFLHALDTAGLRHTFKVAAGDGLRQLSEATGGEWLHNSNDLGAQLTHLSDTYRQAYILGFRPTKARAGHNSIVVRVKNLPRGAHVTYRRGFVRAHGG